MSGGILKSTTKSQPLKVNHLTLFSTNHLKATCWLVVKLGTPQDRRLDRSDERLKGDCERTKGEGEMSTLTPSFSTPH